MWRFISGSSISSLIFSSRWSLGILVRCSSTIILTLYNTWATAFRVYLIQRNAYDQINIYDIVDSSYTINETYMSVVISMDVASTIMNILLTLFLPTSIRGSL